MKRKYTSIVKINGNLYGECITKLNGKNLFDLGNSMEAYMFREVAKQYCGEPIPDGWNVGDELPDLPDDEFAKARRNAKLFIDMRKNYVDMVRKINQVSR